MKVSNNVVNLWDQKSHMMRRFDHLWILNRFPNLCNSEKYYELWKVELSKLQKHCSAHQPHCAVPQHILLRYLSVLHCLLCCVSSLCFDVSAVSVISPSFSCFMVSPRKKYSSRSVTLNAIKVSCNLLFTVPSLPQWSDPARSLSAERISKY